MFFESRTQTQVTDLWKSKILSLFITGILCLNLSAQSDCYFGYSANFCVGEKYYVYADAANVRTGPDTDSDIKFKLPAGREVLIVSVNKNPEELIMDGLNGQWLFVSETSEEKREGWIWSNTLSCKQLRRGDIKFVFGIDKAIEYGYKCTIKAVENGKIVDRKNYEIGFEEKIFNNARIMDNVFLDNVKHVVHLCIGGGACGFGENNIYFAWLDEKKKLVDLPKAWSVSEACQGAYSEMVAIPTENNYGIYNLLVKVSELISVPDDYDDEDCDRTGWPHEYKTELYRWNGEKAIICKTKEER